jgi:hypothetical protein
MQDVAEKTASASRARTWVVRELGPLCAKVTRPRSLPASTGSSCEGHRVAVCIQLSKAEHISVDVLLVCP